ncbi:MAG: DMT family transporter [Granulosicoccus sp.]
MPKDNNMKGILLMALGFFSFSVCDAVAKLLTEEFHPFQVVWLRMLGLFIGVCVLIAQRGTSVLHTPKPHLQIIRGIVAACSATLFVFAINYVPLADAIAVSFVAPFIVTIFGALLLKEPVGIRRWLAVLAGFIGMLVVIRPGTGVFHPAIFLVLFAAVFFAIRQLTSRWLSGVDPITTTVCYTAIVAFSILSVFQPFYWVTPSSGKTLWLVVGMAATSAAGEILIIRALDIAHSVVLAPLHYTLIIWGTFYGFIVFGDLPDQWTLIGCSIIVTSGLYTTYREYQSTKPGINS